MVSKRVTVRLACSLLTLLLVVQAVGGLAGCAAPAGPGETPTTGTATSVAPTPTEEIAATVAPSPEQKLVIGIMSGPKVLDPDQQTQRSMMIYRLLYDKLAETDAAGKLQPSLAESWEALDELTWRFHLREGVTFHNGEPFNAEAVKYTIDFDLNPENNRTALMSRGVRGIASVEVVDEYTVDIITEEPNALLVSYLSIVDMLPPKYYAEVGPEGFNQAPVGTGMYKYVDWLVDQYVKLEANEDYWQGAPTIKQLEFRIIPEASARVAALRTGEVDMVEGVPPEMAETLEAEGFTLDPALFGQSFTFIFGRETRAEGTERVAPLKDKRVRQALQYAIDKDAIVERVSMGWARKLEGQLGSPDVFGYDPNVTAYPYDPDKARELLAEAGYPDGFTMPMACTQGKYFRDKEVCEVLVAQWADIGVTAELEFTEAAVWSEKLTAGTLGGGGVFLMAWNTLPAMDVVMSYATWTGDHPRGYTAIPEFDELYKEQNQLLDSEERLPILWRMAEVVKEEAYMMFLWELPAGYGIRPGVQGTVFRPDGSIDLSQAFIE